tara:strand:+ start:404 stop:1096 length:693 start_codon:yes stop_codon:yes gene_type:complete
LENKIRIISASLIILIVIVFVFYQNTDLLPLLNSNLLLLKSFANDYPYESGIYYFFTSLILLSLSLPLALILGLLSGIIFEPLKAIIIVSFSSSIAATMGMLISRYFFRDFLKERYKNQYEIINNGFMTNGIYYLFALRMTPIFPYFLINLLVGLTSIKVLPYYLATQLGMLPMSIIIILIGKGVDEIILSDAEIDIEFLILLSLLGILPLFFKILFKRLFKKNNRIERK